MRQLQTERTAMTSIYLLIVSIPCFLFSLCMLIMFAKAAKKDPSVAGLVAYGGGVCVAMLGMSVFGIISFIINL